MLATAQVFTPHLFPTTDVRVQWFSIAREGDLWIFTSTLLVGTISPSTVHLPLAERSVS